MASVMFLKVDTFSLIEFEELDMEQGIVFALQAVLLRAHQFVPSVHELHDVFQAVFELLVQQFVTGLCTFEFGIGCYIFLLVAVCVEPILFYGTVQFLLLVLQL